MSKLVILRFEKGNFEQGFPVHLEIRENGKLCIAEVSGNLVPAPEIPDRYAEWQQAYYTWGENSRWLRRQIKVPPQTDSNYSSGNSADLAKKAAENLEKSLNDWLDRSSLEDIKEELLQTVHRDEYARFIVQTNNPELQKLPWELWHLLRRRYRYPEVALSSRKSPEKGSMKLPVKILVILGSDENIDIATDWKILQNKLKTAKLTRLIKPRSEELREKLINHHWDVVFFAGHSATEPGGNDARIWLDESHYLSPQQLRMTLEISVKNGLKLAIFNSCDGLGLARQLENLQIPHIIVMREPIHDRVAQKFLDDFLASFAGGASLHQAVQEARDKLKLLDSCSPNASWLPVIFQNPEELPLFYPQEKRLEKVWFGIGSIALITLGILIYKNLFLVKDCTLFSGISLGEEILTQDSTSEKQAGVKYFANKNYSNALAQFKESLDKKPNDPETRIYLNNAKAENSITKIKIAASVPMGKNQPIAEEILRGVAEVQEEINRNGGINGLPLQIVIANDNNDNQLAEKIADKLVKDPAIFAVVGHNGSNASVAASPIYKNGKLVMISPTSFANELKNTSYIFRMVPQITFFAAQLSKALNKAISNPKVAICVDIDSPDQITFKNEFQQVISAYKGQYIDIKCKLADPSFNAIAVVETMKKNKVNSLLLAPYVNDLPKASEIFKTVRANKLPIALFGSPTLYNDKIIEWGNKAVEGLTLSVPYYPDIKEKESFQKLWQTELNTWRSSLAKDATKAIAIGLEQLIQQPQPTRQKLDNILRDPNFKVKGATGKFKFNPNTGEREFLAQKDRTDALIRVQNGKFIKIE